MKVEKAFKFQRQLGFPLIFKDTSVSGLLQEKNQILKALNLKGCVCIKNVNYEPSQMVQFTKGFWGQAIELPVYLMFNNQDPSYKQVARVGNVKLDGTLKDSQKQAAYWHQDGNFWGQDRKHIYNCLHTKIQPTTGGETHVMDLVQGARFLKNHKPDVYERLKYLIGILNLENINDFKLYNAKNTLGIQTITLHSLINKFGQNDEVLFLSVHQLVQKNTLQPSKDLVIQQVHHILQHQMGFYSHKWEKGDMLIWDNLQVMHRACGGFTGNRLLFKTQGRFNQQ